MELELSVRAYTCLKRAGINSVAERCSVNQEDMMKVRNLGRQEPGRSRTEAGSAQPVASASDE